MKRIGTIHGFPPIAGTDSQWLILGSMPSVESLRNREYYAHPRNALWRILGALVGFEPNAPYDARKAAVVAHRIAIWDVLAACERPGSLDSAIRTDSERPNDLPAFVAARPDLRAIAANGAKAHECLRRHFPELATRALRLPSTSPAHAALDFDAKLAAWRGAALAAGVTSTTRASR